MPIRGQVTLEAPSLGLTVTAWLGEGSATVQAVTGWNVVARPRRVALVDWQGREPMRLAIPLRFDSFRAGVGVPLERQVRNLERMAGIGGGSAEPPRIIVDGAGVVPHDAHESRTAGSRPHEWVLESVSFGDAIRNTVGNRVRQDAEVVLLQYVDGATVEVSPARRRAARGSRGRGARRGRGRATGSRTYVVKRGDTLAAIAARVLGSSSKWRELAKLNGLRDPTRLRVGQTLMPPR